MTFIQHLPVLGKLTARYLYFKNINESMAIPPFEDSEGGLHDVVRVVSPGGGIRAETQRNERKFDFTLSKTP